MLKRQKRLEKFGPLLGFGALLLVFALSLNSYAQTSVEPDSEECTYKVITKIAFAFLDKESQAQSEKLVETWSNGIKSSWPGSNESYQFGECKCKIQFDFEIDTLPAGNNCNNALPGYHCINVIHKPTNSRGNIADASEWVTSATANDAAIVIGQIMGLDYNYHFEDKDSDGNADTFISDSISGDSQILAFIAKNNATCPTTCCTPNKPEEQKIDVPSSKFNVREPNTKPSLPPAIESKPIAEPQSACYTNADCNDTNPATKDTCANPGTTNARCDNFTISTCKSGDNYCPANCNSQTDSDCQTLCGNQVCESGESCSNCPNDCGACAPVCGDRMCDSGETCSNCSVDCGVCKPICGDGICDRKTESCEICAKDCGTCPGYCGDGKCEADLGENSNTCDIDCPPAPIRFVPTTNFNLVQ